MMQHSLRKFLLALCLSVAAEAANAETLQVINGSVSVDVASQQMTRVFVRNSKITAVRNLEDPEGAQLLVQTDEATGDVFIGFDGEAEGRSYSLFVTTADGETIQVLLHPTDNPAKTVELIPQVKAAPQSGSLTLNTNGYSETVTAFIKLMFNSEVTDGVSFQPINDPGEVTEHLILKTVGYYQAEGIRGIVLYITNRSPFMQNLLSDPFMVKGVMAVAISHETLKPGESAYVYIVEAPK